MNNELVKPSQRPAAVTKGITILYILLAIGFILGVLELFFPEVFYMGQKVLPQPLAARIVTAVLQLIILSVWWFFIYKIGKGKNWARITVLVILIIGWVGQLIIFGSAWILIMSPTPLFPLPLLIWYTLMVLFFAIVNIIVICFIFSKSAKPWFKGTA